MRTCIPNVCGGASGAGTDETHILYLRWRCSAVYTQDTHVRGESLSKSSNLFDRKLSGTSYFTPAAAMTLHDDNGEPVFCEACTDA